MKKNLLLLLIAAICFSCASDSNVSETQKEKIKAEIKEVVKKLMTGLEDLNIPLLRETSPDSKDYYFTGGGKLYAINDYSNTEKFFSMLKNQEIEITEETFSFIDSKTVFYFAKLKCLMNFKDGYTVVQEPWMMQCLFKLIDGKWLIINITENGVESLLKNIESVKGLNQTTLIKKYLGKWVQVSQNDSVLTIYNKASGFGYESDYSLTIKGKENLKGKQIYSYNKPYDKFIFFGEEDQKAYAMLSWFVSETKNICIPIKYMNNPSSSNVKFEDEFISPNEFVSKRIVNNKVVSSSTFKRVDSK